MRIQKGKEKTRLEITSYLRLNYKIIKLADNYRCPKRVQHPSVYETSTRLAKSSDLIAVGNLRSIDSLSLLGEKDEGRAFDFRIGRLGQPDKERDKWIPFNPDR